MTDPLVVIAVLVAFPLAVSGLLFVATKLEDGIEEDLEPAPEEAPEPAKSQGAARP